MPFAKARLFIWMCCLFSVSMHHVYAQVYANFDPNEELFQYEVKNIDEFIDRFNDDSASYIRNIFAKSHKPFTVSRTQLLVSLLDLENPSFSAGNNDVVSFIKYCADTKHPVTLSFSDSDWYAEAKSVFLKDGALVELPLILHIKSHGDEWAKWMIIGIGEEKPYSGMAPSIKLTGTKMTAPAYIATSGYVTNFVELHYIFNGLQEPELYFEPQILATARGQKFISAVKKRQLKFQYVRSIKFYFCQVNGWIFSVENHNRKTLNSGWLISTLAKASDSEKIFFRNQLLHR